MTRTSITTGCETPHPCSSAAAGSLEGLTVPRGHPAGACSHGESPGPEDGGDMLGSPAASVEITRPSLQGVLGCAWARGILVSCPVGQWLQQVGGCNINLSLVLEAGL